MNLLKDVIRFPHRCVIYTYTSSTPFSQGEKVVVWEGRCRKESNTSIRTFKSSEHVYKSDYRVQLGSLVGGSLSGDAFANPLGKKGEETGAVVSGIQSGMLIDITDMLGEFVGLSISDAYAGTLGTSVYCNHAKN